MHISALLLKAFLNILTFNAKVFFNSFISITSIRPPTLLLMEVAWLFMRKAKVKGSIVTDIKNVTWRLETSKELLSFQYVCHYVVLLLVLLCDVLKLCWNMSELSVDSYTHLPNMLLTTKTFLWIRI